MLAADKLQLQSALKQQATALKEKEFQLHHSNLMTVGTQAAVLASLDVTMFIEFQAPHDSEWAHVTLIPRILKFIYYVTITVAFCSNILVVSQTTVLAVLGTSLALRGPDGSMMVATDGLYEERTGVFLAFGLGLATTVASAVVCVWLMLSWEAAFVCMCVVIYTGHLIFTMYRRVRHRFEYDESETVNFDDIFQGPAAIRAVPAPPISPQARTPRKSPRQALSTPPQYALRPTQRQRLQQQQQQQQYDAHFHRQDQYNQDYYEDDYYDDSEYPDDNMNGMVEMSAPLVPNSSPRGTLERPRARRRPLSPPMVHEGEADDGNRPNTSFAALRTV